MRKYPFTPLIEAQVAYATATIPRFFNLLGHALEPERMPTKSSGLLVQAAQTLAKTAPCTSALAVVQHLRWQMSQGKLTLDDLQDANDLLDTGADVWEDDLDALVAVVKPIIKRSLHRDVLEEALDDYGKGGDVSKAAQQLAKVMTLGDRELSLGVEGLGSIDDILEAATSTLIDPLRTGIIELDALLHGGLERAALGMVLGGSGSGKSLFLSHVAAETVHESYDVAYITLELSEAAIRQRIYCNLLGMTPQEMSQSPQEAVRRYKLLEQRPSGIGRWMVVYMTPMATTPGDVKQWLRDVERERGFEPDLLVVDYADKMVAVANDQRRSYEVMRDVYEGLRDISTSGQVQWCWTASQSGRSDASQLGLNDVSDSMNKVRIADLVLTIVRTDQDKQDNLVRFGLPKRRNAPAHGEAGPLEMDAGRWRLTNTTDVDRKNPW